MSVARAKVTPRQRRRHHGFAARRDAPGHSPAAPQSTGSAGARGHAAAVPHGCRSRGDRNRRPVGVCRYSSSCKAAGLRPDTRSRSLALSHRTSAPPGWAGRVGAGRAHPLSCSQRAHVCSLHVPSSPALHHAPLSQTASSAGCTTTSTTRAPTKMGTTPTQTRPRNASDNARRTRRASFSPGFLTTASVTSSQAMRAGRPRARTGSRALFRGQRNAVRCSQSYPPLFLPALCTVTEREGERERDERAGSS